MNKSQEVYRVIDANLNRLNEGLRVVEEYFRFVTEEVDVVDECKSFRHRVGEWLKTRSSMTKLSFLSSRDTSRDCLSEKLSLSEKKRLDLEDVLDASFQRVKESLRVLEEYIKILDVADESQAGFFQKIRFDWYAFEKKVKIKFFSFKMFQREETSKVEMLAVGSVALDDILSVAGSVERVMGGSCVHFSLAANLFFPVHLVGVVGDDYPQEHLDFLTDKGIGIGALEKKEGKSFYWRGRYVEDFSSVETLALDLGVFETFDPSLSGKYLSPKYLFLANIDPVLQMKILNQVERPHLVVMDTMNHWIEDSLRELWEVIKKVDVLILNDGEARLLSGQNDLLKAAEELITKGPKYLIIKRGENGSIFLDNEGNFFSIPAYPVKNVIDTTGAGDSFAGAFMGYVAFCDQISLEVFKKAMAYASCVASFTVQGFGVQGLANIEEKDILERFLEFKRMSTF